LLFAGARRGKPLELHSQRVCRPCPSPPATTHHSRCVLPDPVQAQSPSTRTTDSRIYLPIIFRDWVNYAPPNITLTSDANAIVPGSAIGLQWQISGSTSGLELWIRAREPGQVYTTAGALAFHPGYNRRRAACSICVRMVLGDHGDGIPGQRCNGRHDQGLASSQEGSGAWKRCCIVLLTTRSRRSRRSRCWSASRRRSTCGSTVLLPTHGPRARAADHLAGSLPQCQDRGMVDQAR